MTGKDSDFDLDSLPESGHVHAVANPALDVPELFAPVDSVVKRRGKYYAYWTPSFNAALDREPGQIKSHVDAGVVDSWTLDGSIVCVRLKPSQAA